MSIQKYHTFMSSSLIFTQCFPSTPASLITMFNALLLSPGFDFDAKSFVSHVPMPKSAADHQQHQYQHVSFKLIMNACNERTNKPNLPTLLRQRQRLIHVYRIRINYALLVIVYSERFIDLLRSRSVNIWVSGILAQTFPSLCTGFVKDEILLEVVRISICM